MYHAFNAKKQSLYCNQWFYYELKSEILFIITLLGDPHPVSLLVIEYSGEKPLVFRSHAN